MGCYKQAIGATLQARSLKKQKTEAKIDVAVLNKMHALGHPVFERTSVP